MSQLCGLSSTVWTTSEIKLAWYIEIIVAYGKLEKAFLSYNKHKKFSWDEIEANLGVFKWYY